MSKLYVKKPVQITALEWTGNNLEECQEFLGTKFVCVEGDPSAIRIRTLEGEMFASKGDFLIRGILGEMYPCKPNIFHLTYDEVPVTT